MDQLTEIHSTQIFSNSGTCFSTCDFTVVFYTSKIIHLVCFSILDQHIQVLRLQHKLWKLLLEIFGILWCFRCHEVTNRFINNEVEALVQTNFAHWSLIYATPFWENKHHYYLYLGNKEVPILNRMHFGNESEGKLRRLHQAFHLNPAYLWEQRRPVRWNVAGRPRIEKSLLHRLGYEISSWQKLEAKSQPHFYLTPLPHCKWWQQ